MDKGKIEAALVAVIKQVQETSGRPAPDITESTTPIGDIDGFDSLLAVEATVMLEQALGCTLSDGTPFVSRDGKKALTLVEIVDRVAEMITPGRAA